MGGKSLRVEIAFATAEAQIVKELFVLDGATIGEVIEQSGFLQAFPQIDLASNPVGIYGARASLEDRVHDGDRVEIYRPLIADPKKVRRERAERMSKRRNPKVK